MSAFGLSRQLNIPRKESQKYMDLYFERYPGVLEYMERTRAQAKEKGYVETRMAVVSISRTSNPVTRRAALVQSVLRSTPRCRVPQRTSSSAQ